MDAKQYEAILADAELRTKKLRTQYDLYFQGIERVEPQQAKKDLATLIAALRREQIRNTALRFRFQQLVQRYTTFDTYWRRISRQMEEGTYKRDLTRARRRREEQEDVDRPAPNQAFELEGDIDVDAALAEAIKSESPAAAADKTAAGGPPPIPDSAKGSRKISPFAHPGGGKDGTARSFPKPPGANPSRGGVSDDDIRQIYARYISARQKNSERTDNVKMESLAKSVRGMMPKLRQKHAGKNIDFQVVVKNGKVALKPVAK